jgi:hypothetical protein
MAIDESLVFALDRAHWHFLSDPGSNWVIIKRRGHIIAGESLFSVAAYAARVDERKTNAT